MKLTTYISASVFIFLSALVIKKNEAKQQSSSLFNTKWALKKIHNPTGTEDVTGKAFIKFDEEKKSAGGNGSCNSFGSSLSIEGNTVQFKNIFSTKMYCEEVQQTENSFLNKLNEVNRFEIKGNVLSLYHDKKLLLEFTGGD